MEETRRQLLLAFSLTVHYFSERFKAHMKYILDVITAENFQAIMKSQVGYS